MALGHRTTWARALAQGPPFAPDMLWTTRYIDAAVTQLRVKGHEISDGDIARPSPLDTRALLSSRVGVRNEECAGRCGFR